MNTHRLFINLRLTLQQGIWEFGFWFLWKTLMEKAVVLGAFDGRV